MTNKVRNVIQVKFLNILAGISGVFALLLCLLIIVTYIQLKRADPLNAPALTILNQQLMHDPANVQLQENIRQLDLLARKAFFTSQWQIRAGGYLLAACLLILVISLKILEVIAPKVPEISASGPENLWTQRKIRRRWIIAAGVLLLVVSGVLAYLTQRSLGRLPALSGTSGKMISEDTIKVKTGVQQSALADTLTNSTDTSANLSAPAEGFPTPQEIRSNTLTFRGPGGIGVSYAKNVPVSWDGASGKNIRWKKELPLPGFNSPIIWNGKIFLSGASKDGKKAVWCMDAGNGAITWTADLSNIPGTPGPAPKVVAETGQAAPTMTTDGRRVYAIFANGDLAAIDMAGKLTWSKNLGIPKNHYGHSSSLIMYRNLLIVQYDQTGSGRVIALEGKTGDKVWETSRNVKVSWASPMLVNTGSRTELILAAEPAVISYDPGTGKELWQMECISGEVGPSLTYANGLVFSVNDYSKLAAIKPGQTPVLAWESDEYLSDVPSPVAVDDLLFLVTSFGVVVCYDAATGEKQWEKELNKPVYSSPMVVDGKLYVLDKSGLMHIFRAEKTMAETGTASLGEGSVCTPVFADGRIYIRGLKSLYCVGR